MDRFDILFFLIAVTLNSINIGVSAAALAQPSKPFSCNQENGTHLESKK